MQTRSTLWGASHSVLALQSLPQRIAVVAIVGYQAWRHRRHQHVAVAVSSAGRDCLLVRLRAILKIHFSTKRLSARGRLFNFRLRNVGSNKLSLRLHPTAQHRDASWHCPYLLPFYRPLSTTLPLTPTDSRPGYETDSQCVSRSRMNKNVPPCIRCACGSSGCPLKDPALQDSVGRSSFCQQTRQGGSLIGYIVIAAPLSTQRIRVSEKQVPVIYLTYQL